MVEDYLLHAAFVRTHDDLKVCKIIPECVLFKLLSCKDASFQLLSIVELYLQADKPLLIRLCHDLDHFQLLESLGCGKEIRYVDPANSRLKRLSRSN